MEYEIFKVNAEAWNIFKIRIFELLIMFKPEGQIPRLEFKGLNNLMTNNSICSHEDWDKKGANSKL